MFVCLLSLKLVFEMGILFLVIIIIYRIIKLHVVLDIVCVLYQLNMYGPLWK